MSSVQPDRPQIIDAVRRLGIAAAATIVGGSVLYGAALIIGLSTAAEGHPISDPWFGVMEWLILAIAPAMVALIMILHIWAGDIQSSRGKLATASMALAAGLTMAVHGWLLTLPRSAATLAFNWPSLPYALDILAWDLFFAWSVLLTAKAVRRQARVPGVSGLLALSGVLAAAGLLGIPLGNMQVRNLGIVGYAVAFPMAALLILCRFLRTPPETGPSGTAAPERERVQRRCGPEPDGLSASKVLR